MVDYRSLLKLIYLHLILHQQTNVTDQGRNITGPRNDSKICWMKLSLSEYSFNTSSSVFCVVQLSHSGLNFETHDAISTLKQRRSNVRTLHRHRKKRLNDVMCLLEHATSFQRWNNVFPTSERSIDIEKNV